MRIDRLSCSARVRTQGRVLLKSRDTGVPPNLATTWKVARPGRNSTKSV